MVDAQQRPNRTVTHVCVVQQLHRVPSRVGVTAIDKVAADGPVAVNEFGLYADVQADRLNHGGLDKAVYLYAATEIAHWEGVLGRTIAPGGIGENLRVEGPLVDEAVIGEHWRVGETLELEVTGPRNPCRTFAHWMDRPTLIKEFNERARKGVYCRVRTHGPVEAGDRIEVLHVPEHGVSVHRWNTQADPADARALLAADAAGDIRLAPYLHKYVLAAAGRDGDVGQLRALLAGDEAGDIALSPKVREHLAAAVARADAAEGDGDDAVAAGAAGGQ